MICCKFCMHAVIESSDFLIVPAAVPYLIALVKSFEVEDVDAFGVKFGVMYGTRKG